MRWLLLLLTACGTARRGVPLIPEPAMDDPALARGATAFDAHCHACHPGGGEGLAFGINQYPLPGWLIRFQVRNGVGEMPDFARSHLSDQELDDVVAYLKWLRRLPAPVTPEGREELIEAMGDRKSVV